MRLDVRQGNEIGTLSCTSRSAPCVLQDLPQAVGKPVDELPDIPVRLFISHAKGLAGRSGGDSRGTRQGNPRDIGSIARPRLVRQRQDPPGGRFPEEIQKGVLQLQRPGRRADGHVVEP